MRGLLPGSKPDKVRINPNEITAPRFHPQLTPEDLALLRRLEIGLERPPKIAIDLDYKLIVLDHLHVNGEENFRNWRLLKLAAFSYIPAEFLELGYELAEKNGCEIRRLDRNWGMVGTGGIGTEEDEEEEEQEPEHDEHEDDLALTNWQAVERQMTPVPVPQPETTTTTGGTARPTIPHEWFGDPRLIPGTYTFPDDDPEQR